MIIGVFAAVRSTSGSPHMEFMASASKITGHSAVSVTNFTMAAESADCPRPQPIRTAEARFIAGSRISDAAAETPPSSFAGRGRKVASGTAGAIRLCTLSVVATVTMPAPMRRAPFALIAAAPGKFALPVMQSSLP